MALLGDLRRGLCGCEGDEARRSGGRERGEGWGFVVVVAAAAFEEDIDEDYSEYY